MVNGVFNVYFGAEDGIFFEERWIIRFFLGKWGTCHALDNKNMRHSVILDGS